jgi:hypothetical protein
VSSFDALNLRSILPDKFEETPIITTVPKSLKSANYFSLPEGIIPNPILIV